MENITEIAPDTYRISTYIPDFNLQFNQFLVVDDEPLLYHTGTRGLFPIVREAVSKLIDPRRIRWIGFSHFEADECGSLSDWQHAAPDATAICSLVAKMVNVDDVVAQRPSRALQDGEILETGKHRFRFLQTPQVPHAWDAGHLFDETSATLFSSDLFHQNGDLEAMTRADVVGRFRQMLLEFQHGPFDGYLVYTPQTAYHIERLAMLQPETIAPMHGSTFKGDGERALMELAEVMKELC